MFDIKKFSVAEVHRIVGSMSLDITMLSWCRPYLKLDSALGEAPYWEEASNELRFVGTIKRRLHRVNLNEGPSSHTVKDLDISVGSRADIEEDDKHLVFGGKRGYGKMNRKTDEYQMIKKYWDGKIIRGRKKRDTVGTMEPLKQEEGIGLEQ